MKRLLAILASAFLCVAAYAANPDFGDVAFATYESERGSRRIVFSNDTKIVKTWKNMSGGPVNGTYKKKGNEIEVQWDPKAEHHGSLSEKFRQTGPCALAR